MTSPIPGTRHVLSEAALAVLSASRQAYDRGLLSARPVPGRIPAAYTPLGGTSEQDALQQGALLRYVSIAEAYIDALLEVQVTGLVPPRTAEAILVLDSYLETGTRSWPTRVESYKSILNISFTQSTHWPIVESASKLRNAIAHALGAVSGQAGKRKSLASAATQLNGRISGGRVLFGRDTTMVVWSACRGFVRDVDFMIP